MRAAAGLWTTTASETVQRFASTSGIERTGCRQPNAHDRSTSDLGEAARPLPVVVNELVDILLARQAAEKEVLQHGIVQDDHARTFQRTAIDGRVQLIVAEVIQIDVSIAVHAHIDAALEEPSVVPAL